MKKILLMLLVNSVFFGNSIASKIVKTFDSEDIEVKVIKIEPLNEGLSIAVVEEKDGVRIPVFVTNDGENVMGIGEPLILGNTAYQDKVREVYKQALEHNQSKTNEEILKNTPKNAWIKLEGKAKQGEVYLVLDANCSYCKQEVARIDQMLKDYKNLYIVFVGFLNENSMFKAAAIYQGISNANQEQKITMIKQAFEKNFQVSKSENTDFVRDITRIVAKTGIRGVPYIIKKD